MNDPEHPLIRELMTSAPERLPRDTVALCVAAAVFAAGEDARPTWDADDGLTAIRIRHDTEWGGIFVSESILAS